MAIHGKSSHGEHVGRVHFRISGITFLMFDVLAPEAVPPYSPSPAPLPVLAPPTGSTRLLQKFLIQFAKVALTDARFAESELAKATSVRAKTKCVQAKIR